VSSSQRRPRRCKPGQVQQRLRRATASTPSVSLARPRGPTAQQGAVDEPLFGGEARAPRGDRLAVIVARLPGQTARRRERFRRRGACLCRRSFHVDQPRALALAAVQVSPGAVGEPGVDASLDVQYLVTRLLTWTSSKTPLRPGPRSPLKTCRCAADKGAAVKRGRWVARVQELGL